MLRPLTMIQAWPTGASNAMLEAAAKRLLAKKTNRFPSGIAVPATDQSELKAEVAAVIDELNMTDCGEPIVADVELVIGGHTYRR